jgi:hypothetical protein
MVMKGKTPEEKLKEAQRIVARYVPKDRDLVAELIDERRAKPLLRVPNPLVLMQISVVSMTATTQSPAPVQTIKPKGGDG